MERKDRSTWRRGIYSSASQNILPRTRQLYRFTSPDSQLQAAERTRLRDISELDTSQVVNEAGECSKQFDRVSIEHVTVSNDESISPSLNSNDQSISSSVYSNDPEADRWSQVSSMVDDLLANYQRMLNAGQKIKHLLGEGHLRVEDLEDIRDFLSSSEHMS